MIYFLKVFLSFSLTLAFILPGFLSAASMDFCESADELDKKCNSLSTVECRELLEECQSYLDQKSAQIEADITKTEEEKKTLQSQIYSLGNKIENLSYQIYQSNLVIKDIKIQVTDTESSIIDTSLEIDNSKERLAGILRTIYEEDQKSIVEVFLGEDQLSDFFNDLVALEELSNKNKELLGNIKEMKFYLEGQKESLDEEKESVENLVAIQNLQKTENQSVKNERENFLKMTEAEYQKQLKEKEETEEKAQAIRTRLFELIGVPDAPTFEQAYEIAKFVSERTGIRPALLLAVLKQESNLGKNVGQCFLTNTKTGEGIQMTTKQKEIQVMKPSRDISPFLAITQELGKDPYNTPVSCPMKDTNGKPFGYGGAMGPSQFIPSTWIAYKDEMKAITGKLANPWDIRDAFLATGIYLKDLGGNTNEFNAVMKYFSGSNWSKWEEFYGRSVLAIAADYENDIKEMNY